MTLIKAMRKDGILREVYNMRQDRAQRKINIYNTRKRLLSLGFLIYKTGKVIVPSL